MRFDIHESNRNLTGIRGSRAGICSANDGRGGGRCRRLERFQRDPTNRSSPMLGSRRNRIRAMSKVVSAAVKKNTLLHSAFTTKFYIKKTVSMDNWKVKNLVRQGQNRIM